MTDRDTHTDSAAARPASIQAAVPAGEITPEDQATGDPLRPTARPERIVFWDVLRGVAVLGVLAANMPLMSLAGPLTFTENFVGSDRPLDVAAFWAVRLLADTKFVTIFSILFGAGLGLMSEKALARRAPFAEPYLRRLAALFVFGMVHGLFIWFGDILTHYAMMGAVALLFRRARPKTLLVVAGVLLVLFYFPSLLVPGSEGEVAAAVTANRMGELRAVLSSGDFRAMLVPRVGLYLMGSFFMLFFWGGRTLALFLVGMALVKSAVFVRPEEHRRLFRRMVVVGGTIGLALEVALIAIGTDVESGERVAFSLALYLHGLFLAAAYIGLVALWCLRTGRSWLRERLAAVGQMAFTNYISHSVITAIIFNYMHQFDRWGRFEGLLLTFAIYAFQLLVSPIWLARFRFGPLEWLWRTVTYGPRRPVIGGSTT